MVLREVNSGLTGRLTGSFGSPVLGCALAGREMRIDIAGGSHVSGASLSSLHSAIDESNPSHSNSIANKSSSIQQYSRVQYSDRQPTLVLIAQLIAKRILDIVGSVILLALTSPLLLFVFASIRLTSRGSALFVQERIGLNNNIFRILKFRSMYVDGCDSGGIAQTIENDSRVTPIGRIIRQTNIDELPQLINVLKGDMSLVGPRPHVPGMLAAGVPFEQLVADYNARHRMRPGMTGLAQSQGLRGPTTNVHKAKARVEHDLAYIDQFSLWLDAKIVFWTIRNELKSRNGF